MRRIALSPWSQDAMDPDVLAALDARAADLGCYVSTVKRTRAPAGWVVRAFSEGRTNVVEVRAKGPLEVAIEGALDRYQVALFTADELMAIQRQSV